MSDSDRLSRDESILLLNTVYNRVNRICDGLTAWNERKLKTGPEYRHRDKIKEYHPLAVY